MFSLFEPARGFLKVPQINIDNSIFRLHYKLTALILIIFSLTITAKQYIGEPIYCTNDGTEMASVIHSFCWIYSTFTDPTQTGTVGKDIIQPGVSHHVKKNQEWKHHKYYQWVCFTLLFQGILFYTPHYLWKNWEGGLIKRFTTDLIMFSEDREKKENIRRAFIEHLTENLQMHEFYVVKFFFCEILNFVNVIAQIYFIDFLLDGEFVTYGWEVMTFIQDRPENRIDPMSRVFPKMTKCTFYIYGSSGLIQNFDSLCILPVNVINEKIYIFMWFWFIILAGLSLFVLIYRMMTFFWSTMRYVILKARSRFSQQKHIKIISIYCTISEWFLLNQIGKNIDPLTFKQILQHIANKLDNNSTYNIS